MTKMRINDRVVDTEGPLTFLNTGRGCYLVGEGLFQEVADIKEALTIITGRDSVKRLGILAQAFECAVELRDVAWIRYQQRGRLVWLEDVHERLGHRATGITARMLESYGYTIEDFVEWLVEHGAERIGYKRRAA